MSNAMLGQPAPSSSSQARFGVVVGSPAQLNLDGNIQSARWAQDYIPQDGDAVLVIVISGPTGQSSNVVVGKIGADPAVAPPDEARVTVAPAASPTVTVSPDGGATTYTAKVVGPAPVVGDLVLLEHRNPTIYSVGKIGSTPAPPPPEPPPTPPPPPPPPPQTGVETFSAIDSGTARVGGPWSPRAGQNVTQGTWDGAAWAGSWFYGTGPASLAGRTITDALLYLPARRRQGNYNAPATFHIYAHSSAARPAMDVTRIAGPFDITIPVGWAGDWIRIPTTLAAHVVAGGGLGIAGDPYAGFDGRGTNPMSGTVQLSWSA